MEQQTNLLTSLNAGVLRKLPAEIRLEILRYLLVAGPDFAVHVDPGKTREHPTSCRTVYKATLKPAFDERCTCPPPCLHKPRRRNGRFAKTSRKCCRVIGDRICTCGYQSKVAEGKIKLSASLRPEAQILRTCRLLYDEGIKMLYGANEFVFTDPYIFGVCFLSRIGRSNARHLRKLRFAPPTVFRNMRRWSFTNDQWYDLKSLESLGWMFDWEMAKNGGKPMKEPGFTHTVPPGDDWYVGSGSQAIYSHLLRKTFHQIESAAVKFVSSLMSAYPDQIGETHHRFSPQASSGMGGNASISTNSKASKGDKNAFMWKVGCRDDTAEYAARVEVAMRETRQTLESNSPYVHTFSPARQTVAKEHAIWRLIYLYWRYTEFRSNPWYPGEYKARRHLQSRICEETALRLHEGKGADEVIMIDLEPLWKA